MGIRRATLIFAAIITGSFTCFLDFGGLVFLVSLVSGLDFLTARDLLQQGLLNENDRCHDSLIESRAFRR